MEAIFICSDFDENKYILITSNRSSTIKHKYFKHINNIISSGTVEDTARIHSLELIKL